jgi:hypothetical protein
MFSQLGRAVGLGGAASGLTTLIGALALTAYWSAATQHEFGWFLTVLVTLVVPATLIAAVVGGAIFALVQMIASLTPLVASRMRYAGLAALLAALVAGGFVFRYGTEGLYGLALLFPFAVAAAGVYVGGKMARG